MSMMKDERELLSKPGDTILETLEYMKMSQVELADRMGKTPSKINDIISGKEPITINTALQLEKVLGIEAQFWLNREMLYREKLSRIEEEERLEESIDWLKSQPVKELKKCGYIKSNTVSPAMANEFLRFYGVVSPVQWENLYVNQYVATSFRKSAAHRFALSAMSAWLRIGEIEMKKLRLKAYDKDNFKTKLLEIKSLIRPNPEDFATRLQELCFDAGVALIYTICISTAPISGATRWISGNPLIQLTDRYKTNDQFWFTFFHEAGHILLHGKKDVFIENFDGYSADIEKEKEADEFAVKCLLPGNILDHFSGVFTEKEIRLVAREYDTHPGIIVGRLQHLKIIPYSVGNNLKQSVFLDHVINKAGNI